jgi:hypothetical protein
MRARHLTVLAALGACALLGACGSSGKPSESSGAMVLSGTRRGPTATGAYYVSWRAVPSPIPVNEVFQLEVRVYTDPTMRLPARDVSVGVDAAMPEHKHGMNLAPQVSRLGEGLFKADGMLFHMPGRWELYIDVRGPEGHADRAAFEVRL